jgi:hypothetical protein
MDAQQIRITSYSPHRSPDDLLGIRINSAARGPWDAFVFAVLLAFLALPAITSVSFAEESVSLHEISWQRRFCRSGFLAAKIALLLPLLHFAALDLSYGFFPFNVNEALYLQLVVTFFGCLFGMSWVLNDQRQSLPGVFAARGASCACRPAFKNISGVERDRADVHGRPHAAACSVAAHQLVWQSAVDDSRSLLEVSFCRSGAGLSRDTTLNQWLSL